MSTKKNKIKFIASVKEDSIGNIQAIANNFKKLGCTVQDILTYSGIITGNAKSGVSLNDLKIEGIKNVELDRKVSVFS